MPLSREDSLEIILENLTGKEAIFATTGMLSRELFEIRKRSKSSKNLDFLVIGGMGHASSIALGFAANRREISTWCLEGDGSLLMHAGALANIGKMNLTNFKHIIFNNFVHDSVGGQPTDIDAVMVPQLAMSMGYSWAKTVAKELDLINSLKELQEISGPALLEILIKKGNRSDLGRPDTTPKTQLMNFMKNLEASIEQ